MKNLLLALTIMIAILIASCTVRSDGASYSDVSVAELSEMLESKDFTMVNVHIPFEGDLPQTDLSIAYHEIEQHLDLLPDKDAPIVLYCRSDRMSRIAAKTLVENSYTNVYNLEGGFMAWQAVGLPMAEE
ncbi:MAG TPA: rhodanese-like domain-containing protein [Levilinea sp.]|nr:rhodanese-like domain-containing protein [Levilinea sp.]